MKQVAMIGIGPGDPALLTGEARQAIAEAELLIGARRMVAPFADGKETFVSHKNTDIAAKIQAAAQERVAVLFSGDVGFYSGTAALLPLLEGCRITCHCGVSSFHYFCARLQIPWQDVYPISFHGRSPDLAGAVRRHKRVFALTGGNVAPLCQTLTELGFGGVTVHVGENLSYETERIVTGTAAELAGQTFAPLSVMLIEHDHGRDAMMIGLPDGDFCRGEVPMTKSEVRCVSIAKLRLHREAVCWDVGAGTGSVAVEMAFAAKHVYAVERNAAAAALIRENQRKFGLSNLTVAEGEAPDALAQLPPPDAVFLGGTGGRLAEILSVVFAKNPAARVVLNAVTLETLAAVSSLQGALPIRDFELVQLQAARGEALGRYHRLAAQSPVFIISFRGDPNA